MLWVSTPRVQPVLWEGGKEQFLGTTQCFDRRKELAREVLDTRLVHQYRFTIHIVKAIGVSHRQMPGAARTSHHVNSVVKQLQDYCHLFKFNLFFELGDFSSFLLHRLIRNSSPPPPVLSSQRPATPRCWRAWPCSQEGWRQWVPDPCGSWSRQTPPPGTYRTQSPWPCSAETGCSSHQQDCQADIFKILTDGIDNIFQVTEPCAGVGSIFCMSDG